MDFKKKQTLVGEVVSDKMEKTVVVRVTRKIPHPVYGKYIKRNKKYLAHINSVQPKIGDIVKLTSMRPTSKRKRWCVGEIIRESIKIG